MPAPITKEGYRKVAFFVIRRGGKRSHEKVGPTRTRGGREYAGEVKPSENAAAKPIPLPAPIIKEGYRKVAFFCY